MFITRDKGPDRLICLWVGVEKKELYMRPNGMWALHDSFVPRIMEISAEIYLQVFECSIPEPGSLHEVNKLRFETIHGLRIE